MSTTTTTTTTTTARSQALNVLVYDGAGVSSLQPAVFAALKAQLSSSYDVIAVDAATLASSPWEQTAALVVMPGGRDLAFLEALAPAGTAKLAAYVRGGGRYLGLCAGAYFACAQVQFEVGRDGYEVVGSRPVVSGFVYNSEVGAAAVGISVEKDCGIDVGSNGSSSSNGSSGPTAVYVNGGPCFSFNGNAAAGETVLARYSETGSAAIIESRPGDGHAVLVGPHIEVSAAYIASKVAGIADRYEREHLSEVVQQLVPDDHRRKTLFAAILDRLGLRLNAPTATPGAAAADAASGAVAAGDDGEPQTTPIVLAFGDEAGRSRFVASFPPATHSGGVYVDTNDAWTVATDMATFDAPRPPVSVTAPVPALPATAKPPPTHWDLHAVTAADLPASGSQADPHMFSVPEYLALISQRRQASRGVGGSALYGLPLMYSRVVTSTQTILEKNFALRSSLPDGVVFVGSHQVSGRGRGRNSWISQQGCLQFSFKMSHADASSIVFIQYLFGLAVVEAVQSLPGCKALPVCLKWPNDIYARTPDGLRKIGGILITSEYTAGVFSLVVGCGLNVSNPRPTLCLNDLPLRHEAVLAAIMETFGVMYDIFMSEPASASGAKPFRFKPFLNMYYAKWVHAEQRVGILENGQQIEAVIEGLDASGLLRARLVGDGSVRLLQPDGNSFDMLRNLLFAKQ
ncbi:biotin-protein ligase [Entophlyctis helioformis]|nr:biotin-protein ligase [Entophlyctis helioformis]